MYLNMVSRTYRRILNLGLPFGNTVGAYLMHTIWGFNGFPNSFGSAGGWWRSTGVAFYFFHVRLRVERFVI